MDPIQARLEGLEQRTHTVERQLSWWRGLACSLIVLALLSWGLPSGTAQEGAPAAGPESLAQHLAAIKELRLLLRHLTIATDEDGRPEVVITRANLRIVNGLGSTELLRRAGGLLDCPNGLGNLIVGYNESRADLGGEDIRTGSHNVVVGQRHNFSRLRGVGRRPFEHDQW